MLTFDVALVRIRETVLVLVPVNDTFSRRPAAEQRRISESLQRHVARARLSGTVVPVWSGMGGRLTYFARPSQHALIDNLTWEFVVDSLNFRVTVGRAAQSGRTARLTLPSHTATGTGSMTADTPSTSAASAA